MIMNYLQITNYKCYGGQHTIAVDNLTIFAGKNNIGKSSAIEAILLLHRAVNNVRTKRTKIWINDNSLGLSSGMSSDLLNINAEDPYFSIEYFHEDDCLASVEFHGDNENLNSDSLIVEINDFKDDDSEISRTEIYFLSAERIGPRVANPAENLDFPHVGIQGQHCGLLFKEWNGRLPEKVLYERAYPGSAASDLETQTNYWLNHILPGVQMQALVDANLRQHQIRMIQSHFGSHGFLSTNVGFGLSYLLPIIVQCLVARKGSFVIIENPESHLHPSAQSRLGHFLAFMSTTGLKIILETHSDHIIDGVSLFLAQNQKFLNSAIIDFFEQDTEDKFNVKVTPIRWLPSLGLSKYPKGFMDETNISYTEIMRAKTNYNLTKDGSK